MKLGTMMGCASICFVLSSLSISVLGQQVFVAENDLEGYPPAEIASVHSFSLSGTDLGFFAALNNPSDLVFDRQGNLYVASSTEDKIEKFSSAGIDLGTFAITGHPYLDLDSPHYLAIDANGDLFVSTFDGHHVERFSAAGVLLNTITIQTGRPAGIALDTGGNLYVATFEHGTVERYSPDGTFLGTFVSGLSITSDIAFDAAGNLDILDVDEMNSIHSSVKQYSPSGFLLNTMTSNALDYPMDMDIAPNGDLFISNPFSGTIRHFSSTGNDLGDFITGAHNPHGIAFGFTTPEPSVISLLAASVLTGVAFLRRRRQKGDAT